MFSRISKFQLLSLSVVVAAQTFASFSHAADATVSFDSDVKLSVLSKNGLSDEQSVAAGNDLKLKPDTVYWVSSQGKVPLLVVPQNPRDVDAGAKLQLPNVKDWPSEFTQSQIQSKMSTVIDDLLQFQMALAKKDTAAASRILDHMEATQPLDYYSFLRASLSFVKGDLKAAKEQVNQALKRYPANEQGLRMLKVIEGASK